MVKITASAPYTPYVGLQSIDRDQLRSLLIKFMSTRSLSLQAIGLLHRTELFASSVQICMYEDRNLLVTYIVDKSSSKMEYWVWINVRMCTISECSGAIVNQHVAKIICTSTHESCFHETVSAVGCYGVPVGSFTVLGCFNPFTADPFKALHFAILV